MSLAGLEDCHFTMYAVHPEMISGARKGVVPCKEFPVEAVIPMKVVLLFMWLYLAQVSPKLFVLLPTTCFGAFALSFRNQRMVEIYWRWGGH